MVAGRKFRHCLYRGYVDRLNNVGWGSVNEIF